ncbi:MAG TPA: LamG domain-containing protein, partial [Thermoanaerobaculia bacterium]|nr:LamG domain-containing protein [Thermoanaerobaculia bacterium]
MDGLRLRAGIPEGYTHTTRKDVLVAGQWLHVAVTFDKNSKELQIYVNGKPVETAPDNPGPSEVKKPVARIGAPAEGFLGQVEEVRVWERVRTPAEISAFLYRKIPEGQGTDLIGYWGLNEGTGLETKDLSKSKCHGRLQGPKWIVSTAPVAAPRTAYLYIDERGLLTASEMVDFAAPRLAPTLLEGADGLIHAYFPGPEGEFQVAHCDIQAARATYSLVWATLSSVPESQKGLVKLVARDPGPVMNQAQVTVAKATVGGDDLCQVRIKPWKETQVDASSIGQVEEIWTGVPRRLDQFLSVLQGRSTGDPLDNDVKIGKKVFFDFAGRYPVSRLQIEEAGTSACLLMVSLKVRAEPLRINWNPAVLLLDRVIVTPGAANPDILKVQLDYRTLAGDTVSHTWQGVPADVEGFANTLNGISASYDYRPTIFGVLYQIAAGTSTALLLPRTEGLEITALTIAGAVSGDATRCRMALTTKLGGIDRSATWDEVPRDQDSFAMVLQGVPVVPLYDYGAHAQGEYKWIAGQLLILTDHAPVAVANTSASKPERADLLAAASLIEAIPESTRGRIGSLDVPAKILQKALVSGVPWSGPSPTFAVGASDVPANGLPVFIEDTPAAALAQPGTAGGWLTEPPRNALIFHGDESIEVSSRSHLAIRGSISMEAWIGLGCNIPGDGTILHFRDSATDLRYWLGIETHRDYTGLCLESGIVSLLTEWPDDLELVRPYTCELWLRLGEGSVFRLEVNGPWDMHEHLTIDKNHLRVAGRARFDKVKR